VLQKKDENGGEEGGGDQSHSGQFVRRKKWVRQIVLSSVAGEDEDCFMRDDVSMISDMDASPYKGAGGGGGGEGDGKYEYSDDEDDDDEAGGRGRSTTVSSVMPSFASSSSSSTTTPVKGGAVNNFNSVIRCPELSAIGKQMKALETSCKKQDEAKREEWKKSIAPGYKAQVKELEKRIDTLKKRLVVEAGMGIGAEHLAVLEEELKTHTHVYETFKRQLYFPESTVALGENGVYFALDDFFLEHASGQFILDLVPGRQHPQVILLLTGTAVGDESGVSIRLKIGKFKLKGDKGKGVPSLSFDTIKVTTVLRVTAMLSFDMDRKKWVCGSENFSIDMLYFRGPFGIRQSLVQSVLTLTTPLIRGAILDALPPELGVFVAHLPSPLSVRGEFTITGTELNNFTAKLQKSPEMCALVGYSPSQMMVFMSIQKSIDRSSGDLIKTMEDLLNYRKIGTTYHREWDEIKNLWNEAIEIYFSKANITAFPPLSFEQMLMGTDEILRNPLSIQFALHSCECQVSLRSVLENVIDFFVRWRATHAGKDEMIHVIKKLKQTLVLMGSLLGFVSQNLDFADLKVALKMMAGPKGLLHVNCKDIIAQVPLAIMMNMPTELGLGFAAPVPHLFFVRSQADGELSIEMLHLGSNAMKSRTAYGDWKARTQAEESASNSNANNGALSVNDIQSTRFLSSHSPLPDAGTAANGAGGGGPSSSLMKAFSNMDVEEEGGVEDEVRDSFLSSDHDSNSVGSDKPQTKRKMSIFSFKKSGKSADGGSGDTSTPTPATSSTSPAKRRSSLMPSFKKRSTDSDDTFSSSPPYSPPAAATVVKPKRRFSTSAGRALQLSRQPTARTFDTAPGVSGAPVGAGSDTQSVSQSQSSAPQHSHAQLLESMSDTSSVASNLTKETGSLANENVNDNYFNKAQGNHDDPEDGDAAETGRFITASERERRSLAKTLQNRPPKDGLHRMLFVRVMSPHISVIVDQMLKLKPGAELLNVKLGPVAKGWTPFGFENSTPLHDSREAPTTAETKQTLVNTNPATARFTLLGDAAEEETNEDQRYGSYKKGAVAEKPSMSVLGCPMLLQTSEHIKALAQIPNVEIDVHIASVLRFVSNFFDDIDVLRRFLGVMDPHLQDEIDEYIFLVKVLIDRLGKYFLLPNLELEVNISAKIVATDEDIILTVQPNVPVAAAGGVDKPSLSAMGNSSRDFSSSSGGDNVIQLFAKINVMDVVGDYLAVASAMTRCAEFYEQNHGDEEEGSDEDARSEA
jgi:hypothetical protein